MKYSRFPLERRRNPVSIRESRYSLSWVRFIRGNSGLKALKNLPARVIALGDRRSVPEAISSGIERRSYRDGRPASASISAFQSSAGSNRTRRRRLCEHRRIPHFHRRKDTKVEAPQNIQYPLNANLSGKSIIRPNAKEWRACRMDVTMHCPCAGGNRAEFRLKA